MSETTPETPVEETPAVETPAVEATPEQTVETPTPAPTPLDLPTPPPAPVVEAAKEDDAEPLFTAADIEKAVQARLGRAQKQFEKELNEVKASLGGADLAAAETARQAAVQELEATKVDYAIRFASVSLGVPADQTDAIVKLTDSNDFVVEGSVDADKVKAAVEAVLAKYPGLSGSTTVAASTGEAVGSGPASADPQKIQAENLYDAVVQKFSNR